MRFTIYPYKDGEWIFDDETVGLIRERFVRGAPELIEDLMADLDRPEDCFRLDSPPCRSTAGPWSLLASNSKEERLGTWIPPRGTRLGSALRLPGTGRNRPNGFTRAPKN